MPKITKRILDALRPAVDGKDIFLWDAGDGSLKGFGVRLKPSGTASYPVQYRNREARTRRLGQEDVDHVVEMAGQRAERDVAVYAKCRCSVRNVPGESPAKRL